MILEPTSDRRSGCLSPPSLTHSLTPSFSPSLAPFSHQLLPPSHHCLPCFFVFLLLLGDEENEKATNNSHLRLSYVGRNVKCALCFSLFFFFFFCNVAHWLHRCDDNYLYLCGVCLLGCVFVCLFMCRSCLFVSSFSVYFPSLLKL